MSLAACNLITGVDAYEKCNDRGCDADDRDDDTTSSGGAGASTSASSTGSGGGGACAPGTASLALVVTGSGFKIVDASGDLEVVATPAGAEGRACLPTGERSLRALHDGADFDGVVWGEGCTPVPATPSRCAFVLEDALTLAASAP